MPRLVAVAMFVASDSYPPANTAPPGVVGLWGRRRLGGQVWEPAAALPWEGALEGGGPAECCHREGIC